MKTLTLALAALAVLLPSAASAQGCAEFSVTGAELRTFYDPFGTAAIERTFNMRVRRIDERATSVRLLLVDPDPVSVYPTIGIQGPARYDIVWARDQGRRVFVVGGEQPNNTNGALVSFGAGRSTGIRNEMFRLRVPAGQDVGAGTYYQPLDIRFQCYAGEAPLDGIQMQSSGQVAVDLVVPERISSFIGSAGVRRGRLDFGVLGAGAGTVSRNLSVTTLSTVPYEVEIDAQYGALKRSGDDRDRIPYAMWFAEIPVRRGSRVGCARSTAPSGRAQTLRAEVNAQQAASVRAGSYGEVITLTFSPRLGLAGATGCTSVRR